MSFCSTHRKVQIKFQRQFPPFGLHARLSVGALALPGASCTRRSKNGNHSHVIQILLKILLPKLTHPEQKRVMASGTWAPLVETKTTV